MCLDSMQRFLGETCHIENVAAEHVEHGASRYNKVLVGIKDTYMYVYIIQLIHIYIQYIILQYIDL
jgi:hypothetical protein